MGGFLCDGMSCTSSEKVFVFIVDKVMILSRITLKDGEYVIVIYSLFSL